MGAAPTKALDNVYCRCRMAAAKSNSALTSREKTAELLSISVSTLTDYELGKTKAVPVDRVQAMSKLYHAPELAYYYCKYNCPLGEHLPEINYSATLDRITVETAAACDNIETVEKQLIAIAADGTVDEAERPQLLNIIAYLDKISTIAANLKLWTQKNVKGCETVAD